MQFNNKFRIFGLIIGVLVLAGLVGVMALTVQRAQQLTSTITRPKAAGGDTWVEGCKYLYNTADSNKCNNDYGIDPVAQAHIHIYDASGTELLVGDRYHNPWTSDFSGGVHTLRVGQTYKFVIDPNPDFYHWPWRANVCLGKHLCFSGGKSLCSDKVSGKTQGGGITCDGATSNPQVVNSNEVTITPTGASTAIGFEVYNEVTPPNNFTAIDPINNKPVTSLTPTFSWNSDGVAYQVICIGTYSDGHPPGSCNFVNCTADFSPAVHSYVPTTPLLPNTDYRWLVYGQPGNPAPTTGCQNFRTGAGTVANTIPNCTNLSGPTTLTVGQAGTFSADYSSPQGNLGGTIDAGQNGQFIWDSANTGISGNSGHLSFAWTPTAAGTYDVLCRAWNDGIAECRGKSNYVDAPPRYACAGPNSSMTVTVSAVASCVDSQCADDQKCGNNICIEVACVTAPECKKNVIANHTCNVQNIADGTTCGTAGLGNTCQSGVCTAPSCSSGQTLCSGVCKNLQTDTSNCGACGKACPSGQVCTNGSCVAGSSTCNVDSDCSGGNVCAFP